MFVNICFAERIPVSLQAPQLQAPQCAVEGSLQRKECREKAQLYTRSVVAMPAVAATMSKYNHVAVLNKGCYLQDVQGVAQTGERHSPFADSTESCVLSACSVTCPADSLSCSEHDIMHRYMMGFKLADAAAVVIKSASSTCMATTDVSTCHAQTKRSKSDMTSSRQSVMALHNCKRCRRRQSGCSRCFSDDLPNSNAKARETSSDSNSDQVLYAAVASVVTPSWLWTAKIVALVYMSHRLAPS